MTNTVDSDEAAHHEPPHQNLRCLYIQQFSSLELKVLKSRYNLVVKDKASVWVLRFLFIKRRFICQIYIKDVYKVD